MNLVFFGSSAESVFFLEQLHTAPGITIRAVVTKKEQPSGRDNTPKNNPVTQYATHHTLTLFQIEKVRDVENELRALQPTLFFVVDFGKIIPQDILNIPSKGAVNFHPSLLPKYRGPSPITTQLLEGETQTGFTYILMDAEMDHGPIIFQSPPELVLPHETNPELKIRLFSKGAASVVSILKKYIANNLKPQRQDHEHATYTKMTKKEDGEITFARETAATTYNKIRAFTPWPTAYFFLSNKKRVQILAAALPVSPIPPLPPQKNFYLINQTLITRCAENTFLELVTLKPEGKTAMSASAFWQGYAKLL